MSGTMIAGTMSSATPVSSSEVTSSITVPPTKVTKLRIAMESEEPTTVWISVVSAVRREHLARARHFKEARREIEDMAVDVAADIGDDTLADPASVIEAHGRGEGHQRGYADQREEIAVDQRGALAREADRSPRATSGEFRRVAMAARAAQSLAGDLVVGAAERRDGAAADIANATAVRQRDSRSTSGGGRPDIARTPIQFSSRFGVERG